MRRRDLLAFVCGSAVASPGWAQTTSQQHRLAVLTPVVGWRKWPISRAFLSELGRLGYVEGKDLAIQDFTTEGHVERIPEVARQVVASKPDVIICTGDFPPALMAETSTIPIITNTIAPLAWGFTKSLAHPGGNLTGISFYDVDFAGKQLELLKEAVPSAKRVAVLMTQITKEPAFASSQSKLREYATALGMSLVEMVLRDFSANEIQRAFAEMAQNRPNALLLNSESPPDEAELIVRLADANRLPTMYPYQAYIESGGLMAYTADAAELGLHLADEVHRILQGVTPRDIPFYQASHYKLTINLKAAKAIGFAFPQSLLARADEVIE